MVICKRVIYRGRVQGVGFRYTVSSLARGFGVEGTVRNCSDGSVELVVQGESDEVRLFTEAIGRKMAGYIEERIEQDRPAIDVKGFQIVK